MVVALASQIQRGKSESNHEVARQAYGFVGLLREGTTMLRETTMCLETRLLCCPSRLQLARHADQGGGKFPRKACLPVPCC
jgi:hypothetical protein